MDTPGQPVTRRGAIAAGVGLAVAGFGVAGQTRRPVRTRAGRARDRVSGLTPQQLAGQRVISSYTGLTPPASLMQQISAGETAGVIFYGNNISSESQIASVIAQMVRANQQSPVGAPLLLLTDQEGGLVNRLPGAPAMSEKQIGESPDPAAAASAAGTGAGQNLAGVGMNLDLAPVLDVYRKAGGFIDQYHCSYSKNPATVSACGRACITAMRKTGVAPAGKHFPGLGAAAAGQDTDVEPVTLNVSLPHLRAIDEPPYQAAIAAGLRLVMVSWAVYPALDASRPAGLSPAIVGGELRGRLGFGGVTITDALEAGALRAHGTSAQRGVLAAAAGMDLLLCAEGDPAQGQDVATALAAALASGQLGQAAFTAAVNRVTALRGSL